MTIHVEPPLSDPGGVRDPEHETDRQTPRIGVFLAVALSLVVALGAAGPSGRGALGVPRAEAQAYEGFGAATPGGEGKAVVPVTNLKDSGPGSLRDAVSQGNRKVVFDVAGIIQLTSPVRVKGAFVTIDGSSAKAPGITLRGAGLAITGNDDAHDIIVRGIRIRAAAQDGISIALGAYNVVVDHVSVDGSGDGNIDITESAHDVTISWSILARPRFDKNMLIKYHASRISLHHNLFIDSTGRNPLVSSDDSATPAADTTADLRNNVIANWAGGAGTSIETGPRVNAVNNLYTSPASGRHDQEQALLLLHPEAANPLYASGNFSADPPAFAINDVGTGWVFPAGHVTVDDACVAGHRVAAEAGLRPLDAVDEQHVASVSLPSCPRAFVISLPYHALHRGASEEEIQAWLATLGPSPGPMGAWSAIRAYFDPGPFRAIPMTPLVYVALAHRAVLGRDPDDDAFAFYTGHILARFNSLFPVLLGSEEFGARAQQPVNTLVANFYQQTLGRPATADELQRAIKYVSETADIAPGVALVFNSDEFTRVPRTFGQYVQVVFNALLGRPPAAEEEGFWVDYLVGQLASLPARPGDVAEYEARIAKIFSRP